MPINDGTKPINLTGWGLIKVQYCYCRFNSGQKTFNLVVTETDDPNQRQNRLMTARTYRKNFSDGKIIIRVRTIMIFEKGPYVQYWVAEPWLADKKASFNIIVRINQQWLRLQKNEGIRPGRIIGTIDNIRGAALEVYNRENPDEVIAELVIGR